MKHHRYMEILAMLTLIFAIFAGCGKTSELSDLAERLLVTPSPTAAPTPTPAPTAEPTPEPEMDLENLVTDAFADSYTAESGHVYTYSVPQINLTTPEIEALNAEIYELMYTNAYEPFVANAIRDFGYPIFGGLSYEWAVNDDILSLWVCARAECVVYRSYNISIGSGTILSDHEVLSYAGVSEEEYSEKVRQALCTEFLGIFDNACAERIEYGRELDDDFYMSAQHALEKTILPENVANAMPFIDRNGDLSIIGRVYNIQAMSDADDRIINLAKLELPDDYRETIEMPAA